MKKLGLLLSILVLVSQLSWGQPWNYNFGTGTGTFTTASTFSLTFLPDPMIGGGVDARVRIGTGAGSFNLENQTIAFGSDSYLRASASTSTSVNKFSIYDYSAAPLFTLRFTLRLGPADGSATGATSGTWYLFVGDGSTYSDNTTFSGTQVFTGLRFAFGTDGAITMNARVGGVWTATGITGTPFIQGTTYIVDIYGNNSTITEAYTYGSVQTVAANTLDIWVNGTLVADDIGKALIGNGANIDSWMFYGENSVGNVSNIFLDDFYYANELSSTPLPVELTSFSATTIGKDVKLSWNTATEINNYGFDVERSVAKGEWEKIGFVNGNGNSNSPKNYSFVDDSVTAGTYSYRLKQIDNDGQFEYSKTVEVNLNAPKKFELSQNYPNPFNPTTTISYNIPEASNVKLTIYNLLGQEIITLVNKFEEAGVHTATFNASELNSGLYIYKLQAGSFNQTRKMTLIK
jgi:hypothetical protein